MPIYEYVCKKCHHRFEKIQKFSDPRVKKCPQCRGPVEQALHAPAVQFKGTGWYVTDYARKHESKESKDSSSNSKKDETSAAKEKTEDKGKKAHKKHD